MQVQVVPLTDFVHGQINAREGRPQMMEKGTADDLERAGLIRIRIAPTSNKAPVKTVDDGPGQPSSALLQAPVSPGKTLHLPERGGLRPKIVK